MRSKLQIVVLGFTVLLAFPASVAEACVQTADEATLTINAGGKTLYLIVADNCDGNCIAATFLYYEGNRVNGLQREDFVVQNNCGGHKTADTLLFS